MFIKVTNNNEMHRGEPLYINVNQISAIYQVNDVADGTCAAIFGGPTGLEWKCQESLEEVIAMIDNLVK